MFDVTLFLGFQVTDDYAAALAKIDPNVINLFIRKDDDCYLTEIMFDGCRYVGKFTTEVSRLSHLKLLEVNVYSLLEKIVPLFPYTMTSLYLIPVRTPIE